MSLTTLQEYYKTNNRRLFTEAQCDNLSFLFDIGPDMTGLVSSSCVPIYPVVIDSATFRSFLTQSIRTGSDYGVQLLKINEVLESGEDPIEVTATSHGLRRTTEAAAVDSDNYGQRSESSSSGDDRTSKTSTHFVVNAPQRGVEPYQTVEDTSTGSTSRTENARTDTHNRGARERTEAAVIDKTYKERDEAQLFELLLWARSERYRILREMVQDAILRSREWW